MKQTLFYIFLSATLFYSCKTTYPLGFETNQNKPVFNYFANGHLSESLYSFNVIDDNKKGKVGEIIKAADALSYAGVVTDLSLPIDLSKHSKISLWVLMVDHLGTFTVKLEGSSTGGANVLQTLAVTKANEWQELTFDFSKTQGAGHQYHRLALFSDIHQKPTGKDEKTLFTNLKLWGKGSTSAFDIKLKDGFRLVVLGSSTAAGTGASIPDSSWVNRCRQYLAGVANQSQVINLALGGYTTYHLLPSNAIIPEGRIQPDTLRNATAALKYKPDAVVINLPSNDTSKDYPVEEQLHNFNTLSSFFEDHQIPVWVCTTQPRNYDEEKRAIQLTMKDSLLARYGDQCLDVWTPFATNESTIDPKFDSGDGVHLNDDGHRLFMEIVITENIPDQVKRILNPPFSLMTYNIRLALAADGDNTWAHRKNIFVQQIRTLSPDIFGIQEALPNQIIFLNQNLADYSFLGDGRDGGTQGEYCAIYYKKNRFSVDQTGTFWLSQTPNEPSKGWDAVCNRICTYGLFLDKQSGEKFWVFNTHLDHQGQQARRQGLRLINQKIKELNKENYPFVLMGDLNAEPEDKIIRSLSRKMVDAGQENNTGTFNAFDTEFIPKRIDYIFLSKKDFIIDNYTVPVELTNGHYPSDHFPVKVEVHFEKQNL